MAATAPTTAGASAGLLRRGVPWAAALALLGLLAWQIGGSSGGVPDPTAAGTHLSHSAVVLDSGLLVFREGLEAILVLAAITASMRSGQRSRRRPVAAGAGLALAASVGTWFVAVGVLGALGARGLAVQAGTGLLAVLVLLLVMNWFFHKVYWTGWIAHHNERRRRLLAGDSGALLGLGLLGFTAVYREGFEVVLFLQNLRLRAGSAAVLEGVAIGLALTLLVGAATFALGARLPYKRMLVLTGILLGMVLVVMVGESAQEMQAAGWLPVTGVGISLPGWLGVWFAVFPTVETLAAQLLAATFVIGSYFLAERMRRPQARRQAAPALRRGGAVVGRPKPLGRLEPGH